MIDMREYANRLLRDMAAAQVAETPREELPDEDDRQQADQPREQEQ